MLEHHYVVANPYQSSSQSPDASQSAIPLTRRSWIAALVLTLCVSVFLNFVPTMLTWRAYETCGMEQIGFPFVFFERGGFGYVENFNIECLITNAALALAISAAVAAIFRNN